MSFNLQSAVYGLQSGVCSLRSAVLQSANVMHRRASYQNRYLLECLSVFSLLMFYYLDYLATVTYRYLSPSFHLFLQILSSFNLSLCFPQNSSLDDHTLELKMSHRPIRVSCAMPND